MHRMRNTFTLALLALALLAPWASGAKAEQLDQQDPSKALHAHVPEAGAAAAQSSNMLQGLRKLLASAAEQVSAASSELGLVEDADDVLEGMPRALQGAKKNQKKNQQKKKGGSSTRPVPTKPQGQASSNGLGNIDTSGSSAPYGDCRQIARSQQGSHWCRPLPGRPFSTKTKYGRQTMYGPSWGGKGWCGVPLDAVGDNDPAPVAISTKYLPIDGISPRSPYCGKCVCIRFSGTDTSTNRHPPAEARRYYGRTLKGRVADMCPECHGDQIDIQVCKPYLKVIPENVARTVGVWTVDWQFVPCNTDCSKFFSK